MEDVWEPGAGVEESSGVMGCGTVRRLSWELERPSSARACGAWSVAVYNRGRGKWQSAERESEGVVVVVMGGTTQPAWSEGPLLHRCIGSSEVSW